MNLISDLKSSIFGVDFRFFSILSEIQGQMIKKSAAVMSVTLWLVTYSGWKF